MLGPLHADMAGQACGAVSLPSPPWLLCQAGQRHRVGKRRVLAVGLTSLHLPDAVGQEHAKRALETTTKQGVYVQLIHGVEEQLDVLARKDTGLIGGDPPRCRCGSGASWRSVPKVLPESNVDRTNKSKKRYPLAIQHFFQLCSN